MKLKHILLFTLCIAFYACSSDSKDNTDDEQEETNTDDILVKKIIWNKGKSDEYFETFIYDDYKLTSIVYEDDTKNVYTYDSNNNLIKDEFFGVYGLEAYTTLEYNSDGKLTGYIENFLEASGLDDRKYKHVLIYNNDGTITNNVYISSDGAEYILDWTKTITKNNDNIIDISHDYGFKIIYSYDDKNNAFKNIHAIEILNILNENEYGALIQGNTKNVVSFIETDDSPGDNYNDSYEYTYNESNYPVTGIYRSKYGDYDEEIETIEFIYE